LALSLVCGLLSAAVEAGAQATSSEGAKKAEDLVIPRGTGTLLSIDRPIGSVIVGDQRTADAKLVGPQLVYVFGAALGKTDLTVMSEDQKVMASMHVVIAPDASGSSEALKKSHPDTGLSYDIVGDRLVLRGSSASVEEATTAHRILGAAADREHSANEATYTGAHQINLKVRFAEVSRNQVRNLGFDWSNAFSAGAATFGLMTGGSVGTAVGAAPSLSSNPYATASGGFKNSRINVNAVLEALESRGVVHTIAEPNLTVKSGHTAKFRAGGDIPIPVPQSGTSSTITIEYHPYGISLEFTPVLIGRNRIAIHVVPDVSEISAQNAVSFSGATIPSFTVRHAETDVELASGETFAIAGLFQRNLTDTTSGVPGVSEVPILGTLFQSQQYQRGETELVILITPYLVEPISEAAAALPTERADGKLGRSPSPAPSERIGFIVE
jgi:pilus assembly protein CpaC